MRREGRSTFMKLLRLIVLVIIVRVYWLLNVREASDIELILIVPLSLLLKRVLVVRGDDSLLLQATHVRTAHLLLTLTIAVDVVGKLGVDLTVLYV